MDTPDDSRRKALRRSREDDGGGAAMIIVPEGIPVGQGGEEGWLHAEVTEFYQ